jgi:hypothetical protein
MSPFGRAAVEGMRTVRPTRTDGVVPAFIAAYTVLTLIPRCAANSCGVKILVSIVDPTIAPVSGLDHRDDEVMLFLDRHYLPVFDNVTRIPARISDRICGAVTGTAMEKRRLYTDGDAYVLQVQVQPVMTAINIPRAQADLYDRAVLFVLDRIPEENYRPREEIFAEVDKVRPRVLGAMLDVLARAMRIKDRIDVPSSTRMADFAHWGAAVAEVIGVGAERFLDILAANAAKRDGMAVEDDPVGAAILAFAKSHSTGWKGSPSELLDILTDQRGDKRHGKYWPQEPEDLSRRLNILRPMLAGLGVGITTGRSNGKRFIEITPSRTAPRGRVGEIADPAGTASRRQKPKRVGDDGDLTKTIRRSTQPKSSPQDPPAALGGYATFLAKLAEEQFAKPSVTPAKSKRQSQIDDDDDDDGYRRPLDESAEDSED